MKDLLEPVIFPHNLMLYGLLLACFCYRKKGLWLLLLFYYLAGNSYIANQVRDWYSRYSVSYAVPAQQSVWVLGCGGTATQLPACAKARLQQLRSVLPSGGAVLISTRYCQPYIDFLLQSAGNFAIDCFDGGDNTYQEFSTVAAKPERKPDYILTSDFHAWRVQQLVKDYGFGSGVLATSSQTFRAVNCGYNCFVTVNLTNFDLYSKLVAEFSSYAVFVVSKRWVNWYQPAAAVAD